MRSNNAATLFDTAAPVTLPVTPWPAFPFGEIRCSGTSARDEPEGVVVQGLERGVAPPFREPLALHRRPQLVPDVESVIGRRDAHLVEQIEQLPDLVGREGRQRLPDLAFEVGALLAVRF